MAGIPTLGERYIMQPTLAWSVLLGKKGEMGERKEKAEGVTKTEAERKRGRGDRPACLFRRTVVKQERINRACPLKGPFAPVYRALGSHIVHVHRDYIAGHGGIA